MKENYVYQFWDFGSFVMYMSGPSLLIESTDSMIMPHNGESLNSVMIFDHNCMWIMIVSIWEKEVVLYIQSCNNFFTQLTLLVYSKCKQQLFVKGYYYGWPMPSLIHALYCAIIALTYSAIVASCDNTIKQLLITFAVH